MSSTEPPEGSTPPPGEPTPPPPAPTPPPADTGAAAPPPPPPPPPAPAGAAPGAAPAAAPGVPHPGELLDRFLARLIDFIILAVPTGILYAVLAGIFLNGFTYSTGEWLLFYLFFSVLVVVIDVGYFAYMESSRGQTIGKQVMKLKVFGPDGASNPTMEQAVRRNIWLAANLLSIIPFLGSVLAGLASVGAVILIAVGINGDAARRQHWFDTFAGGTSVMKVG